MIVRERINISGKYYEHTYSDAGFYIERDGIKYADAIDPYPLRDDRIYTETDELIPPLDPDEAPEEL